MFGTRYDDEQRMKEAKEGMTLGILPSTLEYLALRDMRLTDDLAASCMMIGSGIMDMRLPLVSTYSAKQSDSGLPPQAAGVGDLGGRPREDEVLTEGKEGDMDGGK